MVSVGKRLSRALFIGFGLGLLGFTAIYIMTTGVNTLAGQTVLSPVGLGLLGMGGLLTMALGAELSKDLSEEEKK